MTGEFDYLIEKIDRTRFETSPFRHLLITCFLSAEHLAIVMGDPQIALAAQPSTPALIDCLLSSGYRVQPFPGCTTNVSDYLKRLRKNKWPVDRIKLEGYGLAFRLVDIKQQTVQRLLGFLNGSEFKAALEKKFAITRPNRIETAIQKYLSGYEISPHPDIRSKCLTYLLNVNTDAAADQLPIHTHLLRFKPQREFIYSFWENNPHLDRCWVPWAWCTTERTVSANNSFVLFEAHDRSLHAVKLRYDHTRFQRTQIYGNLWYTDVPFDGLPTVECEQFDISGTPRSRSTKALRAARASALRAVDILFRRRS